MTRLRGGKCNFCRCKGRDMTSPTKRTSSRLSASKTPTKKATPEKRGPKQSNIMHDAITPDTEG